LSAPTLYLYPFPTRRSSDLFNWQSVGVSPAWNTQHNFTGFAAHWNKNYNFGNRFDQWFLNLFPREHPFAYNEGGYLTLSFIPTLDRKSTRLNSSHEWISYAV